MQFIYQAFTIECSFELIGEAYFGQATIYNSAAGQDLVECYKTGPMPSCSTQVRAIGYARNYAEIGVIAAHRDNERRLWSPQVAWPDEHAQFNVPPSAVHISSGLSLATAAV